LVKVGPVKLYTNTRQRATYYCWSCKSCHSYGICV